MGDKSKDTGGLHPRGGAMNNNTTNSNIEMTHSSTREQKSPKMMGALSSGQKSPRTNTGASSLVVHNSRKEKEIDFPALTLRQIVKFAVPALAAVLCDPVMTLVDTRPVAYRRVFSGFGSEHVHFRFRRMIFHPDDCHNGHGEQKYGRERRERISDGHFRRAHNCDYHGNFRAFSMIVFAVPLRSYADATSCHATGCDVFMTRAFTMPCFLITLVGSDVPRSKRFAIADEDLRFRWRIELVLTVFCHWSTQNGMEP